MSSSSSTQTNVAKTNEDTNETKTNDAVCLKWDKANLKDYDTFIFDCDGVVWLSSSPIDGAKEVLNGLAALNKRVLYLSNNSTKDIQMYRNKFQKLFALNVDSQQIFTSASAASVYLSVVIPKVQKYLSHVKILLVGSQGLYNMLENEIRAHKFENVSIMWTRRDIADFDTMSVAQLTQLKLDENVAIVVAGYDHLYRYNDISVCCRYLREQKHEMHLIGTNDDQTFPAANNIMLAGTGSLLAAIQAVSPVDMKICGKPHKLLFDLIKEKHPDIEVGKCLMVGDRLSTDIVFGKNCNMKTALVLTGITSQEDLEKSDIKPTFVLQSIRDLL